MDRRRWVIVGLLLALQGLLPLRWYLGLSDPLDERFAWRMFSPERNARCTLRVSGPEGKIELDERFHSGWVALAARGRRSVAQAAVNRLCEGGPVEVDARCKVLEKGEIPYPLQDCP